MIIQLICSPFILIAKGLINLIPYLGLGVNSVVSVLNLLFIGLNFFPVELWVMCLGSIIYWITVNTLFALVKFVVSLFSLGMFGSF